jgi:hypothetical protein
VKVRLSIEPTHMQPKLSKKYGNGVGKKRMHTPVLGAITGISVGK